jgi:iron complex outermembrane recepter protein
MSRSSSNLKKKKLLLLSAISLFGLTACGGVAWAQQATLLPAISVTAPSTDAATTEGSEAAGYKPRTIFNFGPFNGMNILDVPYSVNVMSAPLLENTLSSTPDDIYRINPLIEPYTTSTHAVNPAFTIRGFNVYNIYEDGMRDWATYGPIALEDKERVEVTAGLTSFLYGAGTVGGVINYVYKRPTPTPLADITLGDYGGLSGFIHGDFGGPVKIPGIQDGLFGYRLNIVGQDGDLAVNDESVRRGLVTAALDWHVTKDLLFQFLASHNSEDMNGLTSAWSFPTNSNGSAKVSMPAAPNSSSYYGEPYSSEAVENNRLSVNFSWKLNNIFTWRSAFAYMTEYIYPHILTVNEATSTQSYSQLIEQTGSSKGIGYTGYSFLDADFDTWSIHHKVTMGYSGNQYTDYEAYGVSATTVTGFSFASPTYVREPAFAGWYQRPFTPASMTQYNNFVLGDEIKFNQYVSALVGGNYARLAGKSYAYTTTSPTTLLSSYNQGKLTPSVSLIIHPISSISLYGTYSEALQQGQIVPTTGSIVYTNAGQTLNPYTGREYELGAKADVHGLLLTAALFRIQEPLQMGVNNNNGTYTYVQSGRQQNDGIELTAVGNVWDGLRIYGGVTLIDPRIKNYPAEPLLDGKVAPNVAPQLVKMTAEYDLPFLRGLTLTGGVFFTGSQAVDTVNTDYIPSYTTADLGFRYRTKLPTGQDFILRFNVKNVTNLNYWMDGLYQGIPRTFTTSAEVRF